MCCRWRLDSIFGLIWWARRCVRGTIFVGDFPLVLCFFLCWGGVSPLFLCLFLYWGEGSPLFLCLFLCWGELPSVSLLLSLLGGGLPSVSLLISLLGGGLPPVFSFISCLLVAPFCFFASFLFLFTICCRRVTQSCISRSYPGL